MAYNEIIVKGKERWAKLGEHEWKLPPMPKKADIWFSDLPKKEQHWRRPTDFVINPEYPNIFYDYIKNITELEAAETAYDENDTLISLSYEDSVKLLEMRDRELSRRKNGIWFMNNGEPTYITGSHYFQLTWGQVPDYKNKREPNHPWKKGLPNPYGDFRRFQMFLHYFIQMVKEDDNCAGACITKAKKTGVTLVISFDILNESTMTRDKFFGMMSKSFDDAKKANFKYFEFSLLKLPDIFKPSISSDTKSSYVFNAPKVKNTGTKASTVKRMNSDDGLNNEIITKPTTVDGFDGVKWYYVVIDEWIKFDGPYIQEVFDATKETTKVGIYEICGKIFMFSYASEKGGRSFKEARQIWRDSAISTKDESMGQTNSGLYRYFVSALDSSQGSLDVYGDSDREKVRKDLLAKREKVKTNSNAVIALMRQYPIDEHEVWFEGGGDGSTFDNIRLGAQRTELEQITATGQPPYTFGYLEWKNNIRGGEVVLVHMTLDEALANPEQAWLRLYDWEYMKHFAAENFNWSVRNNVRDKNGKLKPDENSLIFSATDPTDYSRKSEVTTGSKNAICSKIMQDDRLDTIYGLPVTNRLFADYLERFEDPDDYYEHLLMWMHWTGGYWYPEGNKPWVHTKLVKDGMQNFLMYRNKETNAIEPYNAAKYAQEKQGLLTTAKNAGVKTVADGVIAVKRHLRKPVSESDIDRIKQLKSERVIEQLMDFDPEDTKKSDIGMAYLLMELGCEALIAHRLAKLAKKNNYGDETMKKILKALVS